MRKIETLGQFEQLVLDGVRTIQNAYAVPVQEHVQRLYGKPVRHTAIYTCLDRLVEKGYISARKAGPTPDRGVFPKRFYSITPPGEHALKESAEVAERFLESWRSKPSEPSQATAEDPEALIEKLRTTGLLTAAASRRRCPHLNRGRSGAKPRRQHFGKSVMKGRRKPWDYVIFVG
jgi:DNA-binding PadR family transcriptional regulator